MCVKESVTMLSVIPGGEQCLVELREQLLRDMSDSECWEGRLSSSALATAVSVFALWTVDPDEYSEAIAGGIRWICRHRNSDGGWGDSPGSPSNLSAVLLCRAALSCVSSPDDESAAECCRAAENWIEGRIGGLDPENVASAVLRHYGNDRTFSAPILTMCALAGCLGDRPEAWSAVPQLPFELGVFPRKLFSSLKLRVVSYALPALIAVGLARHVHLASVNPLTRTVRNCVTPHLLKTLKRIQPPNGGFLEAPPLTAFVTMCLAASGYRIHPVTGNAVSFLLESRRSDGSWSIDTNLATWLTSMAVKGLIAGDETQSVIASDRMGGIGEWLIDQQHTSVHPFTGASAGGWGWTDRTGAVPDADDTAGALLALRRLYPHDRRKILKPVSSGLEWLLDLQNADGGIPTFCRGWGRLPFDRSCPDISAHAAQAFWEWRGEVSPGLGKRVETATARVLSFLEDAMRPDGAWEPLWFGNPWTEDQANPVYGTACVVAGLSGIESGRLEKADCLVRSGCDWLLSNGNGDGGWGKNHDGASTVEGTSLAVQALIRAGVRGRRVSAGLEWIVSNACAGGALSAAPIGLYFASLRYSESLYPLIFAVAALSEAERAETRQPCPGSGRTAE